jgi:hypothetical protein
MDYNREDYWHDHVYSQHDLDVCAKWLAYSGCPHAKAAVEDAVRKHLNLFSVLIAWETRYCGRERKLPLYHVHELDEFDGILEEILIRDERC